MEAEEEERARLEDTPFLRTWKRGREKIFEPY